MRFTLCINYTLFTIFYFNLFMSDNNDILNNENIDKVEEYFKVKGIIRNLRNDLKDFKSQHEVTQELEKLIKKVKELRERIKEDETVKDLEEKISTTRERLDLIKEMIRLELLENSQEEVKKNGRKLKLIYILKELKDEENRDNSKKKYFKK